MARHSSLCPLRNNLWWQDPCFTVHTRPVKKGSYTVSDVHSGALGRDVALYNDVDQTLTGILVQELLRG